ncbi:hypothetical protein MNV49_007725 [Pseudohyphozyma bogoriensis]|nr:hypothetical protein MNV49_007725 [Pseudohyphozyma bogoriensis]
MGTSPSKAKAPSAAAERSELRTVWLAWRPINASELKQDIQSGMRVKKLQHWLLVVSPAGAGEAWGSGTVHELRVSRDENGVRTGGVEHGRCALEEYAFRSCFSGKKVLGLTLMTDDAIEDRGDTFVYFGYGTAGYSIWSRFNRNLPQYNGVLGNCQAFAKKLFQWIECEGLLGEEYELDRTDLRALHEHWMADSSRSAEEKRQDSVRRELWWYLEMMDDVSVVGEERLRLVKKVERLRTSSGREAYTETFGSFAPDHLSRDCWKLSGTGCRMGAYKNPVSAGF